MVHIAVCAKYALDVSKVKFDLKTGEPLLAGVPRKISEMDLRAIEEAIRIRERLGGKVTVITVGDSEAKKAVQRAYAMGADEGYLIMSGLSKIDIGIVAKSLKAVIDKVKPVDLILCGSASSDDFNWQVPARLATLLDLPLLINARKLSLTNGEIVAECDFEDGTYVVESALPAVVSVALEINEPRIPSIRAVLESMRREVKVYPLEDLGIEAERHVEVREIKAVETKRKKVIFDGTTSEKLAEAVDRLTEALRKEGVL